MTLESLLISVLAVVIGAVWAFWGFRFFLILLPIWGFFVGLMAGAEGTTALFGDGFLSTVTGWVIGVVLGIVFALLSYLYYYIAIVVLGATVGYAFGVGILHWIGFGDNVLVFIAGIAVAVVFAIGTILLRAPRYLVIILSALGGSAAIVAGVMLLFGVIELSNMEYGVVGAALDEIGSNFLWALVWVVIGAAGLGYQLFSTSGIDEIDRTGYRYA